MPYRVIKWGHYLTRPKEFLITNILVKRFKGKDLKRLTGLGYDRWLFLNNGEDSVGLYYDVKEFERNNQAAMALVNDWTKLKKLFSQGKEVVKEIEEMIEKFKQERPQISDLKGEYVKVVDKLIDYFIYVVEIPYYCGGILEKNNLVDDGRYSWIMKECEDFRSKSHYPDYYKYVLSYFKETLANKLNVKIEELDLATYDELLLLMGGRDLISLNLKNREKGFICFSEFGDEKFIEDEKFLKSFYPDQKTVSELEGTVAQKGVARGRVCVVISEKDFHKFKEGEVIVTIHSNPSFMPILNKCSAIVADEGGMLCHAAIVSRELGKPCITGTRIATKVLKDGDLVEVDADKGVVRKLL
ncbi:PEP-utilizing enzyme [Nanoarchaeota archaeon]